MRRRRVIVGLGVVAVLTAAAVLLWPRGPQPCRATFGQVHEGMTFEEVCARVGGPPGDYTGGRSLDLHPPADPAGVSDPVPDRYLWAAEDGLLVVDFGSDGRADGVMVCDPELSPAPSLLGRLRARLGL